MKIQNTINQSVDFSPALYQYIEYSSRRCGVSVEQYIKLIMFVDMKRDKDSNLPIDDITVFAKKQNMPFEKAVEMIDAVRNNLEINKKPNR